MNDIHFAQKLKKTRSDLAITQQQLADQLHVSRKTVSGWETGRNRPDIDMLRQMAKIYHISLDELVSDAKAPEHQRISIAKPISPAIRITRTSLDIILAMLITGRFTQSPTYYQGFIPVDWLFVFALGLRLFVSRWGLKVIHSLRSPIFLSVYFLFVVTSLYSAFTNLLDMGLNLQYISAVAGVIGIVNIITILILQKVASNRKP